MGGKVGSAPACYCISLGSNPDIRKKSLTGHISEGVTKKTLAGQKISKTKENQTLIFITIM
jgi:hypothetical protein